MKSKSRAGRDRKRRRKLDGIMEVQAVVLDTNVYVAAGFKPTSASAMIVAAAKNGRVRAVWNEATRREVEYILGKIPPLRKTAFTGGFREEDRFDSPTHPEEFDFVPDPDDRKFAALAHAADATLITNDALLQTARGDKRFVVATPHSFWKSFDVDDELAAEG